MRASREIVEKGVAKPMCPVTGSGPFLLQSGVRCTPPVFPKPPASSSRNRPYEPVPDRLRRISNPVSSSAGQGDARSSLGYARRTYDLGAALVFQLPRRRGVVFRLTLQPSAPVSRLGLRSVTAIAARGGFGVDRGVDRRPWKSQRHVCIRGTRRVASLQVERVLRTSVLLLIRWFRVRPPGAPLVQLHSF
jgi:hypothetical protein